MREALGRGAGLVGYLDADLSTPPGELFRLRAAFDRPGVEAVLGARVALLGTDIERSAARHYLGRVFASLASLILRARVYDTQCGAKLFRASPALEAALAAPFLSRWAFDVELLGRLLTGNDQVPGLPLSAVVEVPLTTWHDVKGSKLGRAGHGAHSGRARADRRRPGGAAPAGEAAVTRAWTATLRERLKRTYFQIDLRSLAFGRVVFGLVLIGDLLRRVPWLRDFYSNAGLIPNHTVLWRPPFPRIFSFLFMASLPEESAAWFCLAFVCFVCFTIGYRTKLFHLLSLAMTTSLHNRIMFAENWGGVAMAALMIWTAFLPLGRRWSVDAIRASLRARPGRDARRARRRRAAARRAADHLAGRAGAAHPDRHHLLVQLRP